MPLSVEVTFPFLLGVYEDYTQKQLEKAEVIEILRLIESYIFRRSILVEFQHPGLEQESLWN